MLGVRLILNYILLFTFFTLFTPLSLLKKTHSLQDILTNTHRLNETYVIELAYFHLFMVPLLLHLSHKLTLEAFYSQQTASPSSMIFPVCGVKSKMLHHVTFLVVTIIHSAQLASFA